MKLPVDRYILVEGLRLRYWLEGGNGPDLVLLHGIGGAVDVWRKQFERLPKDHRVLAIDLPGCGRSDSPAHFPPRMIELLASAVYGAMQQLGMAQATVVGSSLGGAVGLALAIHWPGAVSGLVLVSPAGMTHEVAWSLRLLSVRWLGELLSLPDRNRLRAEIYACVADSGSVEEDDIERAYAITVLPGVQAAQLRLLRAYADLRGVHRSELDRLHAGLHSIQVPVLCIWGRQDRILPVSAAAAALHHLPAAGLIIRPACGHLVFVEEPAWFDETVRQFVRSPAQLLAGIRLQAVPATPLRLPSSRLPSPASRLLPRLLAAAATLVLLAGFCLFRQQGPAGDWPGGLPQRMQRLAHETERLGLPFALAEERTDHAHTAAL